ncbi:phage terminase%2C large subunit [Salmonella enterica subsp. enterica serovar Typhimurium str. DT104]|uniref:terminase large subunit n=1 Tax=Salmonella enterica TaxID=28901 RepID=UPI0005DB098B|nr:terminase large subunit [Salmonella enterica]CQG65729.1 phage terminase%2C large subunit [Salmonella enterica subsp. enterica serovar Typhimurium str. DT104]
MSRKSYPNVNAANQYARDVVRGKIVACQFVIQACQRHLDDLMAEKSKSFRYRFDKDQAERAAKFIQLLPHTKGEWAFKRMPITLEPWQLFVICCAFGWVNKGSRLRRFREVYTEIPRKNGKSAISAGVALYCFACDNEFGAEVYSGATTEKQAWEVFRPARLMCKRTPMLTEAFGIEVNASNMNRPEDGARFEPLIGNPGDGSSPHCAVVDEYHEHATDALYTTMLTGMGARRQPLMWAITTAGYNIEGPCYDKRREVIEMLNGSVPNDELFGIIYTVDEGDDWTDPQVLEKANPNIGVSVYREFLLSQQQRAKNNARLANVFKTKHLNIWVSARSAYFNLVSWQSCEDKSLTLEQFEGQPCILAFDLARKLDMNSMARLYTREIDGKTHYYSVAPRFWVPYDTVYSVEKNEDRRTAERFQKWVEMGVLTVTAGAEVDYRYILEEAKAANKISPVSESPIDPLGATGLSHDLADEDLNPITIIQNYTNMSDPMKELEAAIESGRFHHDGNPIMTWCIGNVVGKTIPGNDDVVKPVKEQAENKIDGAVALIMAVGRAMLYEKEDTLSDHIESYGIRSL